MTNRPRLQNYLESFSRNRLNNFIHHVFRFQGDCSQNLPATPTRCISYLALKKKNVYSSFPAILGQSMFHLCLVKNFQWLAQALRILRSVQVSTNHNRTQFWKLLASSQVKSFHTKSIFGTNISAPALGQIKHGTEKNEHQAQRQEKRMIQVVKF